VDVHSKASVFVIQDGHGQVMAQGEVPTTPEGCRRWHEAQRLPAATPVALESGPVAFFVARALTALDLGPSGVEAREVRLKAHRPTQKSDRRDAVELCDGLRRGIYRPIVHVPPQPVGRVRETLARRRHFVRLESAQVHAVKRLLRGAGLGSRSRRLGTEVGWTKLLGALAGYGELRANVEPHRALWRCARAQRGAMESAVTEQLTAPVFAPALRRLQTIPGVGPIVAETVLAVFSNVDRFADAKHAARYAGLVPSSYHSGEREAYGRIPKRGSGELRTMRCEAAHHASRPTHPLHPYFALRCAKRGSKLATIAVAHRLARITFAMLRDGTDFDVAKLNIEEGPFERTTIRRYRLKQGAARQEGSPQRPLRTALKREHVPPVHVLSRELR
jgi:transposase